MQWPEIYAVISYWNNCQIGAFRCWELKLRLKQKPYDNINVTINYKKICTKWVSLNQYDGANMSKENLILIGKSLGIFDSFKKVSGCNSWASEIFLWFCFFKDNFFGICYLESVTFHISCCDFFFKAIIFSIHVIVIITVVSSYSFIFKTEYCVCYLRHKVSVVRNKHNGAFKVQ